MIQWVIDAFPSVHLRASKKVDDGAVPVQRNLRIPTLQVQMPRKRCLPFVRKFNAPISEAVRTVGASRIAVWNCEFCFC
uniref:Uncharacterized protein n=1 Tax=Trichuris muris TaxID=70415 RepID=A0A5S6QPZ7_TRIMR